VVCFCDRARTFSTRTRVLVLQHPRERRMGVGTARFAKIALPNSALRVGVDFADDPVVSALMTDAQPAPYLLFPGPDAVDVRALPRNEALRVVVLDGTWAQARKLLRKNPWLAALPRVAFTPQQPSRYEIRQQPQDFCVSTIEALAEILDAVEPENGPFSALLDPFLAMVERQKWFETHVRAQRHRHRPRAAGKSRVDRLADKLFADWQNLVCVQGEANAWSRHDPGREDPETVHWVAHRPASDERFEVVVAPRRRLGPSTPSHVGLSEAQLRAGVDLSQAQRQWASFRRPGDVFAVWGTFYLDLARADGFDLDGRIWDLRAETSQCAQARIGTVDDAVRRLDARPLALGLSGRGGRRLDALAGLCQALVAPGSARCCAD